MDANEHEYGSPSMADRDGGFPVISIARSFLFYPKFAKAPKADTAPGTSFVIFAALV